MLAVIYPHFGLGEGIKVAYLQYLNEHTKVNRSFLVSFILYTLNAGQVSTRTRRTEIHVIKSQA